MEIKDVGLKPTTCANDRGTDTNIENRNGLTELAELLLEREVVFTEDVERIFGPREAKEPAKEEIEA